LFSVWLVWLLIPVAVCDSLISIPRKLRVEFPGVVYHIMSWGWTGAAVLGDNADGQSDRRMVESGEPRSVNMRLYSWTWGGKTEKGKESIYEKWTI